MVSDRPQPTSPGDPDKTRTLFVSTFGEPQGSWYNAVLQLRKTLRHLDFPFGIEISGRSGLADCILAFS